MTASPRSLRFSAISAVESFCAPPAPEEFKGSTTKLTKRTKILVVLVSLVVSMIFARCARKIVRFGAYCASSRCAASGAASSTPLRLA